MWEHPEKGTYFEELLCTSEHDPHPAVRFPVVMCLCPYYYLDRRISKELFDNLLQADMRILYLRDAGYLLLRFYDQDQKRYRDVLAKAVRFSS